jgi:hypothetical protein
MKGWRDRLSGLEECQGAPLGMGQAMGCKTLLDVRGHREHSQTHERSDLLKRLCRGLSHPCGRGAAQFSVAGRDAVAVGFPKRLVSFHLRFRRLWLPRGSV